MGSGKTPVEMLKDGFRLPGGDDPLALNRVALDEHGSPLILYGVNPVPGEPHAGWVWLVANARAPAYYRQFAPKWDAELALLAVAGGYSRFVTASWVGNEVHHRWLRAMGFEQTSTPFMAGPYGALFQPFTMERS